MRGLQPIAVGAFTLILPRLTDLMRINVLTELRQPVGSVTSVGYRGGSLADDLISDSCAETANLMRTDQGLLVEVKATGISARSLLAVPERCTDAEIIVDLKKSTCPRSTPTRARRFASGIPSRTLSAFPRTSCWTCARVSGNIC